MSEFIHVTQRKARKTHICDLCHEPILPGSEYIHTTGQGAEGFFTDRTHIHCDAIINDYTTDGAYDGYFDVEEIKEQYARKGCAGCLKSGEYGDECEIDPVCCPEAAMRVLHPTVLPAALESIARVRQGRET